MIAAGESLLEYRWSSLPGYGEPGIRPIWLECGSILGEMATASQPMSGVAYVDQVLRRGREEAGNVTLEEDNATASWFFGSKLFGEELLKKLKEKERSMTESPTPPRPGGEYGESMAQRIIEEGLTRFGLSESVLPTLPESDWRKRMIGFEIRKRTSVSLGWISSRLKMGAVPRVSILCSQIEDIDLEEKLRSKA